MDNDERQPSIAPTKTIEEWATSKGMLPQVFPGEERSLPPIVGAVDRMGSRSVPIGKIKGPRANPKFWMFDAARAGKRAAGEWPENKEVTETEFDEAIALATTGHQLR